MSTACGPSPSDPPIRGDGVAGRCGHASRRRWPLYAAPFGQALAIALHITALPLLGLNIEDRPDLVGLIGAAGTATYALACWLLRPVLNRVNPRLSTVASTLTQAALVAAMSQTGSLYTLMALAAAAGLAMCFFWPPLMGWISADVEGRALNRRLGRFNLMWSTGLLAGPFPSAALFELANWLPFAVAAGVLILVALLLLTLAPAPATRRSDTETKQGAPVVPTDAKLVAFRYASWIGLFFGYAVTGMFRFQLPALFRHLQIRDAIFGAVMTVLTGAMALGFILLGRTEIWHYRRGLHAAAQVVIAAVVLSLLWAGQAAEIGLIVGVTGLCLGLLYSCSIFYSATASLGRTSSLMAVHEASLSSGVVFGCLIGGYATQYVSVRATYPICAVLLLVGLVIQQLLYRFTLPTRAGDFAPPDRPT
ncbi:MAG TPA: MFS transporter [Phycisphaerae bacterium]|nr:MFS transporter [Phycisphaerae bacterium]